MAAGDHIRVKRMHGLYYHHGIDVGNGTVIHFSGEPLNGTLAKVCQVSEEEFLKGEIKEIIHYLEDSDVLPAEESLCLAREQLDNQGYHVLFNNCEHFASYCKTRKRKSRQVRTWLKRSAAVAGTVAAFALVIVSKTVFKKGRLPRA